MLMLMVMHILVIVMPSASKRRFVTANVTPWGQMGNWVSGFDGKNILCIQEHHVASEKIKEQESNMVDIWWRGRRCRGCIGRERRMRRRQGRHRRLWWGLGRPWQRSGRLAKLTVRAG